MAKFQQKRPQLKNDSFKSLREYLAKQYDWLQGITNVSGDGRRIAVNQSPNGTIVTLREDEYKMGFSFFVEADEGNVYSDNDAWDIKGGWVHTKYASFELMDCQIVEPYEYLYLKLFNIKAAEVAEIPAGNNPDGSPKTQQEIDPAEENFYAKFIWEEEPIKKAIEENEITVLIGTFTRKVWTQSLVGDFYVTNDSERWAKLTVDNQDGTYDGVIQKLDEGGEWVDDPDAEDPSPIVEVNKLYGGQGRRVQLFDIITKPDDPEVTPPVLYPSCDFGGSLSARAMLTADNGDGTYNATQVDGGGMTWVDLNESSHRKNVPAVVYGITPPVAFDAVKHVDVHIYWDESISDVRSIFTWNDPHLENTASGPGVGVFKDTGGSLIPQEHYDIDFSTYIFRRIEGDAVDPGSLNRDVNIDVILFDDDTIKISGQMNIDGLGGGGGVVDLDNAPVTTGVEAPLMNIAVGPVYRIKRLKEGDNATVRITDGGGVLPVVLELDDLQVGVGLVPGTYTNTDLTVDQFGRITAAVSGSGGGGSVDLDNCPTSGHEIMRITGVGSDVYRMRGIEDTEFADQVVQPYYLSCKTGQGSDDCNMVIQPSLNIYNLDIVANPTAVHTIDLTATDETGIRVKAMIGGTDITISESLGLITVSYTGDHIDLENITGSSAVELMEVYVGPDSYRIKSIGSAESTITITNGGADLPVNLDQEDVQVSFGLTPGVYTNTDLTVDKFGRITAAANGSGGGGGGGRELFDFAIGDWNSGTSSYDGTPLDLTGTPTGGGVLQLKPTIDFLGMHPSPVSAWKNSPDDGFYYFHPRVLG